jgi:hypothetical protein
LFHLYCLSIYSEGRRGFKSHSRRSSFSNHFHDRLNTRIIMHILLLALQTYSTQQKSSNLRPRLAQMTWLAATPTFVPSEMLGNPSHKDYLLPQPLAIHARRLKWHASGFIDEMPTHQLARTHMRLEQLSPVSACILQGQGVPDMGVSAGYQLMSTSWTPPTRSG